MNNEDVAKDGRRKWTLKMVQDLAINRGGKLISTIYKNTRDKLIWECNVCCKQWSANLKNIKKRSSWCPNCDIYFCNIDQAYNIAESKNGKCLTSRENFKNGDQKLEWECHLGHKWLASLYKVKNSKTWCPKCSGTKKKTYEEIKLEIELRGWELLSTDYINQHNKLQIKCKNNHIFYESIDKIIHRGYGCKYCNTIRISENIVRIHFETIFNKNFPTLRPPYMEGLELDGYCSELGIAFEHHGEQHYSLKALKGFHISKTEDDFIALQKRDERKIELCKKYGIKLIVIPSLFAMVKLKDLKSIIKMQCDILDIKLSRNIDDIIIPVNICYNKKGISYDEFYKLYIIENKSRKEICNILNITRSYFDNIKIKFNIYRNKNEK